jgi:SAM-dependent methyltransferase
MNIKKFNKQYFEFLLPQRTRLATEYSLTENSTNEEFNSSLTTMMLKDYDMICNHLPKNVDNILDIGCGLGLIDIALYHHYEKNVNLYLLDKTNSISKDTSIRGFNKDYVFYNSMDATKETLSDNGVNIDNINSYEVSDTSINELNQYKFDLIVSLLSCGWHYSIQTYIDLIKNTLTEDGVLILDIRHNTDQLDFIQQHFDLVATIINVAESKHTGGTIGDRYIFKHKK